MTSKEERYYRSLKDAFLGNHGRREKDQNGAGKRGKKKKNFETGVGIPGRGSATGLGCGPKS